MDVRPWSPSGGPLRTPDATGWHIRWPGPGHEPTSGSGPDLVWRKGRPSQRQTLATPWTLLSTSDEQISVPDAPHRVHPSDMAGSRERQRRAVSARSWRHTRRDRTHFRPPGDSRMIREIIACASVRCVLCQSACCPCPSESVRTYALIGRARVALGLTQKQLGEMFQTSMRTAHRWEGGQAYPDVDQVQRLARAVFPADARLAAQLAHEAGTELAAMGLVVASNDKPAAPPSPPSRPFPPVALMIIRSCLRPSTPRGATPAHSDRETDRTRHLACRVLARPRPGAHGRRSGAGARPSRGDPGAHEEVISGRVKACAHRAPRSSSRRSTSAAAYAEFHPAAEQTSRPRPPCGAPCPLSRCRPTLRGPVYRPLPYDPGS